MNRFFLILFLGFLSVASGFARETVKGVVVDSKGEPIPGVKVEIPGTNESVFTDFDGVFQIILREPTKQLHFFYPGYGTTSHKVEQEMKVILGKEGDGKTECYRSMFDLEGGMGLGGNVTIKSGSNEIRNIHTMLLAGATTTNGAQITKNLFFGIGAGAYLEFTKFEEIDGYDSHFNGNDYSEFSGVTIPLFIYTRWDFGLSKKTAPYIGLRLGYSAFIPVNYGMAYAYSYVNNISSDLEVDRSFIGSWFYQPTLGYRMTVYRKFSINLGLSYLSGRLTKYTADSYAYDKHLISKFIQRDAGALLFNIGFDF